jgi:hypothetical protein
MFTLSLAVLALEASARDCDCSCESFEEMRSTMESLQERAEAGERVMPPPELQQLAACAGDCAMAWGQCQQPGRTTDRPERGSEDTPARRPESASASTRENQEELDEDFALGEPREDLERFHGVYGSDDQPGRDFFVTRARNRTMEGREIPDGYLMIGAMWGDVAPWYMQSVGELRFEQQWTNPGADPLVVEFETDAQGHAVSMRFVSGFLADRGRVERRGELPEGW